MALYLVCNDKGGVGKSTLAPQLAVYLHDLGSSVAVIDADKQLHSAKHIHAAEPSIPVGALTDVKQIKATVPKLLLKHDFIVADAPANLGAETRQLMMMADVVIIPMEPGLKAFESTVATYKLVDTARKASGGKPETVWVVFNKVDLRRQRRFDQWRKDAIAAGLPLAQSFIRMSSVFADSDEEKMTVGRMKRTPQTAKAQADLNSMFAEIFQSQLRRKAANE